MKNPPSNQSPVKKIWTTPELILIASNNIEVVKHHPSVHEHTGHVVRTGTKFRFVNPSGHGFTTATTTGVAKGIVGYQASAAS